MNSEAVLALVDRAFGGCAKPAHLTEPAHGWECLEAERRLRALRREDLRREDLGGLDPMLCCTPAAYAYFAPALARLALAAPDPRHDYYGDVVLFQLTHGGADNRFLRAFGPAQRTALAALLAALPRAYPDYADAEEVGRFDGAARLWAGGGTPLA